MASITRTESGKWRAYVCVNYKRAARIFSTKGEASSWAAHTENDLRKDMEKQRRYSERFGSYNEMMDYIGAMSKRTPLPNCPGIYILFEGDIVSYVGKSKNMLARIADHAEKGRRFTHYVAMPCDESDLDQQERTAIAVLKPMENKALVAGSYPLQP